MKKSCRCYFCAIDEGAEKERGRKEADLFSFLFSIFSLLLLTERDMSEQQKNSSCTNKIK
jgi:hypothetical protein